MAGLLLDSFEGRPAIEVIERDDGFVMASTAGAPANYFAPFRRWPSHERQAMRLVRGCSTSAAARGAPTSSNAAKRWWFDYLFVSSAELERLIADTGWSLQRTIPSSGGLCIAVLERS